MPSPAAARGTGCASVVSGLHLKIKAVDREHLAGRLDAVVSWDCGQCEQRGPLLVQRGLGGGGGLQPRAEHAGRCTVIRPDTQRGWLELWQVSGNVVPVVPIPAECAAFLRDQQGKCAETGITIGIPVP